MQWSLVFENSWRWEREREREQKVLSYGRPDIRPEEESNRAADLLWKMNNNRISDGHSGGSAQWGQYTVCHRWTVRCPASVSDTDDNILHSSVKADMHQRRLSASGWEALWRKKNCSSFEGTLSSVFSVYSLSQLVFKRVSSPKLQKYNFPLII